MLRALDHRGGGSKEQLKQEGPSLREFKRLLEREATKAGTKEWTHGLQRMLLAEGHSAWVCAGCLDCVRAAPDATYDELRQACFTPKCEIVDEGDEDVGEEAVGAPAADDASAEPALHATRRRELEAAAADEAEKAALDTHEQASPPAQTAAAAAEHSRRVTSADPHESERLAAISRAEASLAERPASLSSPSSPLRRLWGRRRREKEAIRARQTQVFDRTPPARPGLTNALSSLTLLSVAQVLDQLLHSNTLVLKALQSTARAPAQPSVGARALPMAPECVRAIKEYTANDDRMISIAKGEVLTVEREEDGWLYGSNSRGLAGFFPRSFVVADAI